MEQLWKLTETTASPTLTYAGTEELLRSALKNRTEVDSFEDVRLHREAAAAFIADQASLLSAIAHAAGLSTARIISDLLYVNTFADASGEATEGPR